MSLRGAAPPAATVVARGPFQAGGVVILDEEEAHHLRVRRVADGAVIRLVDGRGNVATARISFDAKMIVARVVATTSVGLPPAVELLLGVDREYAPAASQRRAASHRRRFGIRRWERRRWAQITVGILVLAAF